MLAGVLTCRPMHYGVTHAQEPVTPISWLPTRISVSNHSYSGHLLGTDQNFSYSCFWRRQMGVAQRVFQTIPHPLSSIPGGLKQAVCPSCHLTTALKQWRHMDNACDWWLLLYRVEGAAEFCTAFAWCSPAWLSEKCTGGSRAGSTEYNASHCYQAWGM